MILAICSLFLLAGCDEEAKEQGGIVTPDNVELILGTTEIEVPYTTDPDFYYRIAYKLQNVGEGAQISVDNPVDWIYDVDCSKKGEIDFKVKRNVVPEIREATLTVTCPGVEAPGEIHVIQEIGVPYPFEFDVRSISKTGIDASVLPLDKEAPYIAFVVDSEMMAEKCSTDQEIFEDDMSFFGEYSDMLGMPISEIIDMFKYVGDQAFTPNTLFPGTSYMIYAYHIDIENVQMASEMVKYFFETESVPMIDVDFRLKTNVNHCHIDCEYSPVNYDGWYFYNIILGVKEDATKEEVSAHITSTYMNMLSIYHMFGMTDEEILEAVCVKGDQEHGYDLEASTLYLNFAVAVNEEALICSEPTYEFVETPAVEPSDNKLTVTFTDLKPHSAMMHIQTTNDDPYGLLLTDLEQWNGIISEMSEEEIKQLLAENMDFTTNGDYEQVIGGLDPETEYIGIAMGIEGGTSTTDYASATFKTTEAKKSESVITMKFDGHYSMDAVAKLDETYNQQLGEFLGQNGYLFPFTINVEPAEGAKVWYGFWDANELEDNPDATEENIIRTLMNDDPVEATGEFNLGVAFAGDRLVFTVVVEDAEGGMTDLFRTDPYVIDPDKAGEAQYFVDNYPWPYEEASASVKTCSVRPVKAEGLALSEVIDRVVSERKVKVADKVSFLNEYKVTDKEIPASLLSRIPLK